MKAFQNALSVRKAGLDMVKGSRVAKIVWRVHSQTQAAALLARLAPREHIRPISEPIVAHIACLDNSLHLLVKHNVCFATLVCTPTRRGYQLASYVQKAHFQSDSEVLIVPRVPGAPPMQ